jgi:hypothetical protein
MEEYEYDYEYEYEYEYEVEIELSELRPVQPTPFSSRSRTRTRTPPVTDPGGQASPPVTTGASYVYQPFRKGFAMRGRAVTIW